MPAIRKKVRFYTKTRKSKSRTWKEKWVTIHVPPEGKSTAKPPATKKG